jgi:hypothetical protein
MADAFFKNPAMQPIRANNESTSGNVMAQSKPMIHHTTQQEKREALRNDQRVRERSTYHSVAQASIDDDRGGRFALGDSKQTVIGSSPISYPQQPSTSFWNSDPVPPEPPLGYSVEAQEPVGEVFERGSTPATAASVSRSEGDRLNPQSVTQSNRFKRRI